MEARSANRFDCMRPARHLVEVTAPQRHPLLASEDERTRLVVDEGRKMFSQGRNDHSRNADDTSPRPGLG